MPRARHPAPFVRQARSSLPARDAHRDQSQAAIVVAAVLVVLLLGAIAVGRLAL
jgi:hypothetical protein